jgi:hypothetical protein
MLVDVDEACVAKVANMTELIDDDDDAKGELVVAGMH